VKIQDLLAKNANEKPFSKNEGPYLEEGNYSASSIGGSDGLVVLDNVYVWPIGAPMPGCIVEIKVPLLVFYVGT
jgi:hypothetical protein